ncbi:MAG: NYN domain-containing protein [bacterium]
MEKISIFVDVQNIYYTCKEKYNATFNYKVFMNVVTHNCTLVKAFAYAIDKGDEKQKKFQKTLESFGFEVKLKPYIQRSDGSSKGDWDVGITIDVLDYAKECDKLILLSGDGDFELLVKKVINDYNIKVETYGVPGLTADNLIKAVTKFNPITQEMLM